MTDTTGPEKKNMNNSVPITIGVCAYNEEKNIERTLRSIFLQTGDLFTIEEIIVVSSGSTDKTDEIVKSLTEEFSMIKLLRQEEREGKNSAINLILESKICDVVVSLNADNVFGDESSLNALIEPLLSPEVGMVGGHPIPTNEINTIAGYASHLLWKMHHYVSLINPKIGELVVFRDIGTRLPTNMQSDEDIIRMELERLGYKLVYAPEAIILNRGPETIKDFIKQRTRVNIGERIVKRHFNYDLPTHDYSILFGALFSSIKEMGFHPIKLPMAIFLEMWSRLRAVVHVAIKKEDDCIWDQVATTKKL